VLNAAQTPNVTCYRNIIGRIGEHQLRAGFAQQSLIRPPLGGIATNQAMIRALIVANAILQKQVSHGYRRGVMLGRFKCYWGVAILSAKRPYEYQTLLRRHRASSVVATDSLLGS
jgi:hypothetical protein